MNNILPIGSVIKLVDEEKLVMIHGRFYINKDKKNFDYVGCIYPNGKITNKELIGFNHEDIEDIYYIGYKNNMEIEFRKRALEILAKGDH